MFNLKKHAEQANEIHEKLLQEQNSSDDLTLDGLKATDKQLEAVRDDKDLIDTTEVQLDGDREKLAESTTEDQLNTGKTTLTTLRDDRNDGLTVRPIDLLNAAQAKDRMKEFRSADVARDNDFWDAYVASEMLGDTITAGPSQLQDNPDRFTNVSTDVADLGKNNKIKKMVTASLRDADKILFGIYYTAAGRLLTASEQTLVDNLTRDKITLIEKFALANHNKASRIKQLASMMHDLDAKGVKHTDPRFESVLEEYQNELDSYGAEVQAFPR